MIRDFWISNGVAYLDGQHSQTVNGAKLKLSYGEECVLTLHFDEGVIAAGDTVMVAYDADMLFGESGTSPMGKAQALVTNADATAQSITLSMPTNTRRFMDIVNGSRVAVTAWLGIYQFKPGEEEGYPQMPMALCAINAMPVVALLSDTVVPIEPRDLYYTKQEVDANFIANAQKGAANGVAGLDAQGKIPAGELPAMDYIPTSEKGAADGVATLDSTGKVPTGELPALPYLPTSGGTVTGAVLSTAGGYSQTIHTIPAASTTYTLVVGKVYEHSPAAAPIYTLPAVSDIYATADIAVIVVFSASALSVAFEDAGGNIIIPLSTPQILDGTVVLYTAEYNALSGWYIMPIVVKEGQYEP